MSFTQTKAIVTYDSPDGKSLNWKYEPILVRTDLNPDEVLVEIESVGICHTDIGLGLNGTKILGHEGVGTIKKLGTTSFIHSIGDKVVLSYSSCGSCHFCTKVTPAYCSEFNTKNLINTDSDNLTFQKDSVKIDGKFFGQSSFAKLTVVNINSIVNLNSIPITKDKLNYLGPFGCGFQTGAGAILNAGRLTPGDTVVIYGFGGVGFAALKAAKIGGASKIIVVDLIDKKLELAKQAGATHVIKPSKTDDNFTHDEIWKITKNLGVDVSLECIGGSKFVDEALRNAASKGRIVTIGLAKPNDYVKINLFEFLLTGKQLISCVEGDAIPQQFIPKMINWFIDGKFAIDKIVKFYPIEEFEIALKDMKDGKVIKPILLL